MKRTQHTSTSALVGGLTAKTFGGEFWEGARQGATSSALNHLAHQITPVRNQQSGEEWHPPLKQPEVEGFGVSFEISFPKWITNEISEKTGVGLDIGLINDKNGISFYMTTKKSYESGISFSVQLERFFITRTNSEQINRFSIEGPGFETSIGLGPVGGSYSQDNSSTYGRYSKFQIFTITYGPGIDIGFTNWNTNTRVSGN